MCPPTLAAYFHTLSPFIVRFSDDVGIRWYGVSYIAGFLVAYLLLRALAARGLILIPKDRVGDALMWLVGCILLGGRLTYCLVYDKDHELLTHFSSTFPFWGVLEIHKGGMASHGGIIGAVVAAWRISRGFRDPRTGQIVGQASIWHIFDALALVTPPGLMFGRLANFVNGELLGQVVAPPGQDRDAPWWSVQFPQELISSQAPELTLEQTQRLHDLALAHVPLDIVNALSPQRAVAMGLHNLVEHAGLYKAELAPLVSARVPSQLLQALAEGPVLFAVLWIVWIRPRKAGVIGGWFLLAYGLLRIITEIWRLPDAQFDEGRPLGLSRGQWLSVPMVVLGAAVIAFAARRAGPKLGGWRSRPASK